MVDLAAIIQRGKILLQGNNVRKYLQFCQQKLTERKTAVISAKCNELGPLKEYDHFKFIISFPQLFPLLKSQGLFHVEQLIFVACFAGKDGVVHCIFNQVGCWGSCCHASFLILLPSTSYLSGRRSLISRFTVQGF